MYTVARDGVSKARERPAFVALALSGGSGLSGGLVPTAFHRPSILLHVDYHVIHR